MITNCHYSVWGNYVKNDLLYECLVLFLAGCLLITAIDMASSPVCLYFSTDLKIPLRISATSVTDMEDMKSTNSETEVRDKEPCCPCPKTEEEMRILKELIYFRKVFENFLHNTIFTPRYRHTLIITQFHFLMSNSFILELRTPPWTLCHPPCCMFGSTMQCSWDQCLNGSLFRVWDVVLEGVLQ